MSSARPKLTWVRTGSAKHQAELSAEPYDRYFVYRIARGWVLVLPGEFPETPTIYPSLKKAQQAARAHWRYQQLRSEEKL